MDALTAQIIHRIEQLPVRKKAALLELLDIESSPEATHPDEEQAAWRAALLDTSVWTEEDVARIEEARTWINQWKPASL